LVYKPAHHKPIRAEQLDVALREWRTIFLYAGLFAVLFACLSPSPFPSREPVEGDGDDRNLLICAWLAGGTVVALIALWQWITGNMLIEAEGVFRVRGLYGSPNNLALYLDRTLAVTLALAVYGQFAPWFLGEIRVNVRLGGLARLSP